MVQVAFLKEGMAAQVYMLGGVAGAGGRGVGRRYTSTALHTLDNVGLRTDDRRTQCGGQARSGGACGARNKDGDGPRSRHDGNGQGQPTGREEYGRGAERGRWPWHSKSRSVGVGGNHTATGTRGTVPHHDMA